MKKLLYTAAIAMAAVACNTTNPLIEGWDTPYGIPDFNAVKECHYLPAVEAGIAQQQAEIDAIIANTEEPTFENVVAAYEKSGAILDRVVGVLFNLSETDGTDSLNAIVEKVLPMLSSHSDNITMNPAFFAKVEVLYNNMENLGLTKEQKMVLQIYSVMRHANWVFSLHIRIFLSFFPGLCSITYHFSLIYPILVLTPN